MHTNCQALTLRSLRITNPEFLQFFFFSLYFGLMQSHVTFRSTGRDQRGELKIEGGTAAKSLLPHMQKGCDISFIHSSHRQEAAMTNIKHQCMAEGLTLTLFPEEIFCISLKLVQNSPMKSCFPLESQSQTKHCSSQTSTTTH